MSNAIWSRGMSIVYFLTSIFLSVGLWFWKSVQSLNYVDFAEQLVLSQWLVLWFFGYIETLVTFCLIHFIFLLQLKLCQPNPDDLGFADSVSVEEIGGARVS